MANLDDSNILINGTFDNGLDDWNITDVNDANPPRPVSGRISFNSGNDPVFGDSIDQGFATVIGNTYSVTLDLAETGGNAGDHDFRIDILDDAGTVVETLSATVLDDDRDVVGFTFEATSTASSFVITNTGATNSDTSDGQIDNARVIDITNAVSLSGDGATNLIFGGAGDDTLIGGGGKDTLIGGEGDDSLLGGNNNVVLIGGAGADTLDGGGGAANTVDYSGSSAGIEVNVGNGVIGNADIGIGGDAEGDVFIGIANVIGSAFDDVIRSNGNKVTLLGGEGDDFIRGAFGNRDKLFGEEGNDTLQSGRAGDTLDGGTGDDVLLANRGSVIGGDGTDTVSFVNRSNAIQLDLTDPENSTREAFGAIFDSIEIFEMTNRNDTVIGDENDNHFKGAAGNDTIEGGAGNDTIEGGAGVDSLDGGAGDDLFIHRDGEEVDDIDGGDGDNVFDASAVTTADEGLNIDQREGTLEGLGGIRSLANVETFIGTQADDTFRGLTRSSSDIESTFFGEGGDDTIIFRSGDGLPDFHGGSGSDTADFSTFSSGGQTDFFVDLEAGFYVFASTTPEGSSGDLIDFENYKGFEGTDVFTGNAANNVFDGNGGDDEAFGGTGNDILRGDDGSDNLRGEEGDDILSGNAGADVLNGGAGEDVLFGGSDGDLMFGGAGFDQLFGGAGSDRMFGGADNDILNGGGDNDIINSGSGNDLVFAQNGNDLIFTQVGNDKVFGGDGNDKIFGGDGNDELNGGAGNDEIFGGSGVDEITGAAGNDIMSGGGGNDTFFLFADQGIDRITDLTGADSLDISSFGIIDDVVSDQDWQEAATSVVTSGGGANVTINWDGGGALVIENIGIASLTDADFIF